MKRMVIFFLLLHTLLLKAPIGTLVPPAQDTHQVIIQYADEPANEKMHRKWNNIINQSLKEVNAYLAKKGYIAPPDIYQEPELDTPPANASWTKWFDYWKRYILHDIRYYWYTLFYKTKLSKYPHQNNITFFTRKDNSFGNFTMHIPDGVPKKVFKKALEDIFKKHDVNFTVDDDLVVQVAQAVPLSNFSRFSFTLDQLEQFKKGALIPSIEKQIASIQLKQKLSKDEKNHVQNLQNTVSILKNIRDTQMLFWYQSIPTTGLLLDKPFYPPPYPFIPHYFSLWELAPKKGRGVKVAVLDTGVSAFDIKNEQDYKRNKDLTVFKQDIIDHNFNLVSLNGLDPLEQLVHVIEPYIAKDEFNEIIITQQALAWIKEYLRTKTTKQMSAYLLQYGQKNLLSKDKKSLNKNGVQAIKRIVKGNNGIEKLGFKFWQVLRPFNDEVIEQCIPAPRITSKPITYIAGHGSHTYGVVGANYQGMRYTPADDTGVSGIAPEAHVFMVKVFKDDGSTDHSTLAAGIKKAILHDADVVNMSLKISDVISEVSPAHIKLMERMLGIIPFAVACSGNDGNPKEKPYPGKVIAYPAKFSAVPFDVGSFAYQDEGCPIPTFSQYEPEIGPKFLAPGLNILSCGLKPSQKKGSLYLFMNGTSMSTPIIAGFAALMQAEFKNILTREQMLKVCFTSTILMHDSQVWKTKSLLGVIDMRMALMTMHILQYIKEHPKEFSIIMDDGDNKAETLSIDFDKKFDNVLQAVKLILLEQPQRFGKQSLSDISFTQNFMNYFRKAQNAFANIDSKEYYIPDTKLGRQSRLQSAISYVTTILKTALNNSEQKDNTVSQKLLAQITEIIKKPTIDLFPQLSAQAKKRIQTGREVSEYWMKQAQQIRKDLARAL